MVREALPFAGVHEVPPLAEAGQPGRRDVVVAALARKRNTEQKQPNRRIIYKVGLSSHTLIFIPGDQCIQISHDVIILWIDFSHYI